MAAQRHQRSHAPGVAHRPSPTESTCDARPWWSDRAACGAAQPGAHPERERLVRAGEHHPDVEVLELELVGQAEHRGDRGRAAPDRSRRLGQLDVHQRGGMSRMRSTVGTNCTAVSACDSMPAIRSPQQARIATIASSIASQGSRAGPAFGRTRGSRAGRRSAPPGAGCRARRSPSRGLDVLRRPLARQPAGELQDARDVEERREGRGPHERRARPRGSLRPPRCRRSPRRRAAHGQRRSAAGR